MPAKTLKKKDTPVVAGTAKRSTPLTQDLAGSNPDWLRDRVFKALIRISPDERSRFRDNILSDLRKAGVNIMSGLIKLGIPATTPDDLSPSDVAKLVRYVRMNRPEALMVAGASLTELIAAEVKVAEGRKHLKEAA